MNVYEKLAQARIDFMQANVKKSGKNTFANYSYYELSDILPVINQLAIKHRFICEVSFTGDMATLVVRNLEKLDECVIFTSPMSTASLKGCHEVQNLGAVQTYIKRYLYQNAFEIVEADALDATMQSEQKSELKKEVKHLPIAEAIAKLNTCKTLDELKNTFIALRDRVSPDGMEQFVIAKDLAKGSLAFDDAAGEVVKIGRLSDANNKQA